MGEWLIPAVGLIALTKFVVGVAKAWRRLGELERTKLCVACWSREPISLEDIRRRLLEQDAEVEPQQRA